MIRDDCDVCGEPYDAEQEALKAMTYESDEWRML